MNRDLQIKTIRYGFNVPGIAGLKYVNITEKDTIDLKFKKKGTNVAKRVYGEIIKIGIDDSDNRYYLVIIGYEYADEDNVFKVHLDEITELINITHPLIPYSFGPVYSPDETAVLIKAKDGMLYYSHDGEIWKSAALNSENVEEIIRAAIAEMHPEGKDMYLYDKCVEAGFEGSQEDLANKLVELVTHIDKIPIVDGATS